MNLILLGINHKTAPIELRERVAIPRELLAAASQSLARVTGVSEAMILSTCNRVEILTTTNASNVDISGFLEQHFSIDASVLRPHIYEYRDSEAVRHLFRVAASLDSMVVGEPQILGQVKDAYAAGREAGTVLSQLDPLLQSAFAAAKKVRSETEIGSSTVSIASVAVDLAQKIFGSLQGKTVFLVGAGKMSELAARHLIRHGAGKILVTNRTEDRATRHGQAICRRSWADDASGRTLGGDAGSRKPGGYRNYLDRRNPADFSPRRWPSLSPSPQKPAHVFHRHRRAPGC